ncbi:hypothetical protein A3D78_03685 [Candidatus Gottesmanbacteria bacterium RIFCSPHIGHO2_02_FULL_39_14]|uniref:Uncharacterized protein n=3 Tax=Candidatus Gottesmaniibacteriota TaxID=1752720 RepID=A0A1F5ZXP9_9BACT|nr:MAG: hypothetical protein A2153_02305 [Candidatus Gottesmanbacteria bacterium RBG_16_38_7b]OGG17143.1 MAG: hypothetical protein A3D78_03685 [Candidatus Gottesmanbacteria bacterium RIFCSPHIGHO2_02_FULL_39_14]OGG32044.1 MAG: hypothetical protein A3I51_05480 [Candidatus Gottesmanbacteria bacterium RIFCSPLOWO2_02_FULL_38_8]
MVSYKVVKLIRIIFVILIVITIFEVAFYLYFSLLPSSSVPIKNEEFMSQVCTTAVKAEDPLFNTERLNDISVFLGKLEKRFKQKALLTIETTGTVENIRKSEQNDFIIANVVNSDGEMIDSVALSEKPSDKRGLFKIVNGIEEPGNYMEIKNGDKITRKMIFNINIPSDIIINLYYYK